MTDTDKLRTAMDRLGPPQSNNGGDIVLQAGSPGCGNRAEGILPGYPGRIVFKLHDGTELMVLHGDGTVQVRGETVDNNQSVYKAFHSWLYAATVDAKGNSAIE